MPRAIATAASVKSSWSRSPATYAEESRQDADADHDDEDREDSPLAAGRTPRRRAPRRIQARRPSALERLARLGSRTSTTTVKRSSTMSQPTAMRPWRREQLAALDERPDEDDGARHRDREAQHDRIGRSPSRSTSPRTVPRMRRDRDLPDRAWDRDLPDRGEVAQREMQAHAEHQQDDADLGELAWRARRRRRTRA